MKKTEIDKFREDMPIIKKKIYFDHAAMSPLHTNVMKRLQNFHQIRQIEGPNFPDWWHLIEETRQLIANWLRTTSKQIAFLSNTSAGINLAAQGFPLSFGDEIIIPEQEFPSNVYPWLHIETNKGVKVKQVPYTANTMTAEQVIDKVSPKTKVISVSWVSAKNGNKIDIAKLGHFCKKRGIYFVVDAIQGFGAHDLDLSKVYVDLLVSGFYKWAMGPDGVSFVYVSEKALNEIRAPWIGWASMAERFNYEQINYNISTDARRFETGNMNFSAIAGVHETLLLLEPLKETIFSRIPMLTNRLRDGLAAVPGVEILSPLNNASGITLFKGRNKKIFEENNVSINYRSGIRVSPHFYNSKKEIDRFLDLL